MAAPSLELARTCIQRGWAPIPVPYRDKIPVTPEWQNLRLEESSLPQYFNGQHQNIGVLNGVPSGGLIDIDLDSPEANLVADQLLPNTPSVFGRDSSRRSHRLYVVNPIESTAQFEDVSGAMLVEYRSTGSQTVHPGSVHPSGEPITWDMDGEPAHIDGRLLKDAVSKLAAASLIARHWPTEGSRQNAAMAVAGGLMRAGWHKDDVTDFILAVGNAAGDEETSMRTKVVEYTNRRISTDQQATGWPTLAELIGAKAVDKACTWLGLSLAAGAEDRKPRAEYLSEPEWEPRKDLPPSKPSVPTLVEAMVPAPLRAWLTDVSSRSCIPLEMVAVPAIIALGTVVGRSIGIRPGRSDDFLVVPNLWGAIIARPGSLKSHAIAQGLAPLNRLSAIAHDRYQTEEDQNDAGKERINAEITAIKNDIGKTAKAARETSATSATPTVDRSGETMASLENELAMKTGELREATIIEKRYLTQDSTIEKLGELLHDNPRGMLVSRDELVGWLRNLDKAGREGDRAFYLEGWNGTEGYTFDRIGRGTVRLESLTLSICGGIQPGKLLPYVQGAISGGDEADGLLQRFQVTVWPDSLGPWEPVDQPPDTGAKNQAFEVYKWLDDLSPESVEAERPEHGIPFLRFEADAQEVFDEWRNELELRLRSDQLEATPAFEAHLSKYRSLMPALALVFHLVAVATGEPPGPVTYAPTVLAAAWCEYLEQHAKKIYSAELFPGVEAANGLAAKIQEGLIADRQSARDIYQHHWSGLSTPAEVSGGLEVLANSGWVRLETVEQTGGRPAEIIRVHPDLRGPSNA